MNLSENNNVDDLEKYQAWVKSARTKAIKEGFFQKANYFTKRSNWVRGELESLFKI